jgi:predicted NUDIX family phosphoesterase
VFHEKGQIVQDEKYLEEYVLAFETKLLEQIGIFQGLSFELDKYLDIVLSPKNHTFIKRKDAESNPAYKQLIPYALLQCGGSIFVYRRGKLLAEKRLLGSYSLGIGGHISVTDPGLFGSSYDDGLKREINEEVVIESPYTQRVVALLNDDSNDVGKVHFGVVHVLTLDKPLVKPREKSINETKFVGIGDLQKDVEKFENWSKICIQNIQRLIQQ